MAVGYMPRGISYRVHMLPVINRYITGETLRGCSTDSISRKTEIGASVLKAGSPCIHIVVKRHCIVTRNTIQEL